ncbi:RimJ/RimL family protein N-acetyltransferase [Streptosporangium album]|uniref:RimJ/RimL family protein N-acetyltransferase n=1 Tax=Streptosporangium album TaxID=47479 RepID=A0A7W7RSB9_9ACTN|nr:GNAT family N-acetyltransferase [Streptosporangium album]MBB4936626.1 RimJ/RimL family protein N-acetyltransferase [Streptosporangium album]
MRLRPMEPSEAESLWRWNSDPEVMRWMNDGYPQTLAQVVERCEGRATNSYDNVLLGIETLDEGRLIGLVRLGDTQPEIGNAELDIYIGEKEFWGKGYATDATREICRYGFDKMRLHSITLWAVAENTGAIRVYEKVGFVKDGRRRDAFRRDGEWHDMFLMTLLEGELLD